MQHIQKEHDQAYYEDHTYRHALAKNGEEPSIRSFCDKLPLLNTAISYARLDTVWAEMWPFDQYPSTNGCPDYVVHFHEYGYLYVEVKIKQRAFMKTIEGGSTSTMQSPIPKFGCPSYYLDKEPVYKNMHAWAKIADVHPKSIALDFTFDQYHRLITLAKIESLLAKGWNDLPIPSFGEGYGKETYLIPVDATIQSISLDENILKKVCSPHLALPHKDSTYSWVLLS